MSELPRDEFIRDNQSYFVLDTINVHRKNILSLAEMMVSSRKGVEKHYGGDMIKAKDYYTILQSEHTKLIEHIKASRLCLFEVGEEELAVYANDLAGQLGSFPVTVKSYWKS